MKEDCAVFFLRQRPEVCLQCQKQSFWGCRLCYKFRTKSLPNSLADWMQDQRLQEAQGPKMEGPIFSTMSGTSKLELRLHWRPSGVELRDFGRLMNFTVPGVWLASSYTVSSIKFNRLSSSIQIYIWTCWVLFPKGLEHELSISQSVCILCQVVSLAFRSGCHGACAPKGLAELGWWWWLLLLLPWSS